MAKIIGVHDTTPLTIMYSSSVSQPIANNNVIVMNFDQMIFNNAPAGSVVPNVSGWTFTVPLGTATADYDISASFDLLSTNGTPLQTYIYILKNGVSQKQDGKVYTVAGAAVNPVTGINTPVRLAAGDVVSIHAYQQSGGSKSTGTSAQTNYVSIVRRIV